MNHRACLRAKKMGLRRLIMKSKYGKGCLTYIMSCDLIFSSTNEKSSLGIQNLKSTSSDKQSKADKRSYLNTFAYCLVLGHGHRGCVVSAVVHVRGSRPAKVLIRIALTTSANRW